MSPRIGIGAFVLVAAAVLTACGNREPWQAINAHLHAVSAELAIEQAISAKHRYSPSAVRVLVGRAELRVVIGDATLAEADLAARENAATAVVGTAEKLLAPDGPFAEIQVISVAIVHPQTLRFGTLPLHTEEVIEFRKGTDGRFSAR